MYGTYICTRESSRDGCVRLARLMRHFCRDGQPIGERSSLLWHCNRGRELLPRAVSMMSCERARHHVLAVRLCRAADVNQVLIYF